jgi:hypothetical protein
MLRVGGITLLSGARADTPRPVTANTEPAKGCCSCSTSESPSRDVVTYRMSKCGPPKVTDVTRLAGIGTLRISLPESGSTLITCNRIIALYLTLLIFLCYLQRLRCATILCHYIRNFSHYSLICIVGNKRTTRYQREFQRIALKFGSKRQQKIDVY